MAVEYAFMVQGAGISHRALERLTGDQAARQLGTGLMRFGGAMKNAVPAIPKSGTSGGEWEVVSHQVLPIGPHLLTTVLLRREE